MLTTTQRDHLWAFFVFIIAYLACWSFDPFEVPFISDNQLSFFVSERVASGIPPHVSMMDPENALSSLLSGAGIFLGRALGLDDVLSSRLVSMTAAAMAATAVWRLARILAGSTWAGLFAVPLMMSCARFFYHGTMGERPKVFVVCFLCMCLAEFARKRQLRAGVFAAGAFLCWQPGILGLLALLLAALLSDERREMTPPLVGGFALGILAYEAYFAYHGALGPQLHQSYVMALGSRDGLYASLSIWKFVPPAFGAITTALLLAQAWSRRGSPIVKRLAVVGLISATLTAGSLYSVAQAPAPSKTATAAGSVGLSPTSPPARLSLRALRAIRAQSTPTENLLQDLRFLASFGLPNMRHLAPFAAIYMLLSALLLAAIVIRPFRALQLARQWPAHSATFAASSAALIFTLVDHQAYPDTFLFLPFVALACALALHWLIQRLTGKLPLVVGVLMSCIALAALTHRAHFEFGRTGRTPYHLSDQRSLAAFVQSAHLKHGSVWALGSVHLLALNRLPNHSWIGHLLQARVNGVLTDRLKHNYRDLFADHRLPEVIVTSRGGENYHIPWLHKGYRPVSAEILKRNNTRMLLKTDKAVTLAEAFQREHSAAERETRP